MASQLEALKAALDTGPTVFLIRHAPRGEISHPRTGDEVPLTSEGHALAADLGSRLAALLRAGDQVVLGHSPVLRCGQTAAAIHAGLTAAARAATSIGERGHLCGPFLRDPKPALDLAAQLGRQFLRRWFDGGVPASLVQPRPEAARDQVERALEVLNRPEPPRLAILVSHDWNLMLIREHYFGIRHEDVGWIELLDGVAIRRAAGGFAIGYGGRVVHVPAA